MSECPSAFKVWTNERTTNRFSIDNSSLSWLTNEAAKQTQNTHFLSHTHTHTHSRPLWQPFTQRTFHFHTDSRSLGSHEKKWELFYESEFDREWVHLYLRSYFFFSKAFLWRNAVGAFVYLAAPKKFLTLILCFNNSKMQTANIKGTQWENKHFDIKNICHSVCMIPKIGWDPIKYVCLFLASIKLVCPVRISLCRVLRSNTKI